MAMPNRVAQWSLAELHRLPDDGNRYELVHGELLVTPAPSFEHQELVAVLSDVLIPYVTAHDLGRVRFPRSVIRFGRHSEVEPDLMVRPIPKRRPTSWANAPVPILVVEVLSGTTRRRDRLEKRALYLEGRVSEYWIIDREDRLVTVVRPGHEDVDVSTRLVWHPAGASEPFAIDLPEYFRTALGG